MFANFFNTLLVGVLLLCASCGKHELENGLIGASSGALVGAAVSNKKNKESGALLGAFIGNVVGRQAGRIADQQEVSSEELHREIIDSKLQNKKIVHRCSPKWCSYCKKQSNLIGAVCCTDCGSELVSEKICGRCYTLFSPDVSYRYCPYCKHGIALSYR